ncbi:urease accessory protein UreG [Actinospica sp. MGRD01-02]|uniref:Urease accessory protein UreG n=1 Tax=Actinospica acidithermotolerans TaxID=2828514 RepID=A0A941EFE8_9ACTN|nr:urease accessory protein UreG [Actinospica acidithermotolerans]MBR7829570.1 urease accessory protein UreG [Actinospica acidithermotolerans]
MPAKAAKTPEARETPEAGETPEIPEAPARRGTLRIGVGGPVGAGKTSLVAALCRTLGEELSIAVVTNDAHAAQDAAFLVERGSLDAERITAVQTGGSPHAAIRDDIAANLEAVESLEAALDPLDLVLIESGGGSLSATFSRGLIDRQIFVIDVAAGERLPRKGGLGITSADLLVVNKTDLAPHVPADLEVMRRDAAAQRAAGPGGIVRETPLPTLFTSLSEHPGAPAVADWVRGLIVEHRSPAAA